MWQFKMAAKTGNHTKAAKIACSAETGRTRVGKESKQKKRKERKRSEKKAKEE